MIQLIKLKMKRLNTNGQRWSYNLKIKGYTFLVCIFLVISLSSCSENPVVPEPPPPSSEIIDSNFFDWEYFDVFGTNLGGPIYAIDTNDILMLGFPRSVRFRNRSIEFTDLGDPDFDPVSLNGIGNTVYIGGTSMSTGKIMLKKLEGNSFSNIDIPFDTASQYIGFIYIYAENDIWLTTAHRYVYRYFNNVLTKYFDNEDTRINDVFLDRSPSGQITAFLGVPLAFQHRFYTYKRFVNNDWEEVGRDSVSPSSALSSINGYGFSPEGRVLRTGRNGIVYIYNDSEWSEYINTFGVFDFGRPDLTLGNSDGNVLISGASFNFGTQAWPVLYYSNNQLYYLSDHRVPFDNRRIFGVNYRNGRYSLVYSLIELFHSKFSIGIPKTKK